MIATRIALIGCLLLGSNELLFCGAPAASSGKETKAEPSALTLAGNIVIKSEPAAIFVHPIKCDADGNIYLLNNTQGTSGIRKFGPKGERLAVFAATSAADLTIGLGTYFAVTDGKVVQLAYQRDKLERVVIAFNKDGSYKSGIKLESPRGAQDWAPMQIAAFASGDFLIAGSIFDPNGKIRVPFTGIFDSSGTLKREVVLSDDTDLQKMAESGDPRVVAPGHEFMNSAIEAGQAELADDGNVYVMRKISPAIFYAVSPAGEIVRRFTIDPGESDYTPVAMHTAGNRIALEFWEPQSRKELIKVTDLEGREIATYDGTVKDGDAQRPVGGAFACYAQNPERFIFLFTSDDGYLGFRIVEPR